MGKHANAYLTRATRASQGVFRRNMSLVSDQREESSTALQDMPQRHQATGFGSQVFFCPMVVGVLPQARPGTLSTRKAAPHGERRSCRLSPEAPKLLQFHGGARLFELGLQGVGVLAA